jgi:hypothetical protein
MSGMEAITQADTQNAAMPAATGTPTINHNAAAVPMLLKATNADDRCAIKTPASFTCISDAHKD